MNSSLNSSKSCSFHRLLITASLLPALLVAGPGIADADDGLPLDIRIRLKDGTTRKPIKPEDLEPKPTPKPKPKPKDKQKSPPKKYGPPKFKSEKERFLYYVMRMRKDLERMRECGCAKGYEELEKKLKQVEALIQVTADVSGGKLHVEDRGHRVVLRSARGGVGISIEIWGDRVIVEFPDRTEVEHDRLLGVLITELGGKQIHFDCDCKTFYERNKTNPKTVPPKKTATTGGKKVSRADTSARSKATATAVAEATLPKGTRIAKAQVVTGSVVRVKQPGIAFVDKATAHAGVVEDPVTDDSSSTSPPPSESGVVAVPVQPGDEIAVDRLVSILLNDGLGIIPEHVSEPPAMRVHVGRVPVVDTHPETDDASETDHYGETDHGSDSQREEESRLYVDSGTLTASILSDLPFATPAVGTSDFSKRPATSHIEILVDGKKHGEVATFEDVDVKKFEEKPVKFWTLNEKGQYRRSGEFEGEVADAGLNATFNKPTYRLGESGLLLISNQETFLEAQAATRVGGLTDPSSWKLTLDPSSNVSGLPKTAGFTTHALPFTVTGKGGLQATVTAVPRGGSEFSPPSANYSQAGL